MRHRLTVAALGLATVLATSAQSPPGLPAAGLILGRVVDAMSRQPVGGAIVRLNGAAPQPPVLTGADGQFLFTALPAGPYGIIAIKPGYLDGGYGQRRPRGEGVVLELRHGDRIGDVTVPLWPWATITGRITDTDGRAAIGVEVDAIPRGPNGILGSRASSGLTDSTGTYAITRLASGRYVVGVHCRHRTVSPATAGFTSAGVLLSVPMRCNSPLGIGMAATSFASTFYLDSPDPEGATHVAVGAGDVIEGIDMRLTPTPVFRIAGSLRGPSGSLPGGRVRLLHADWPPGDHAVLHETQSTADGSFAFAGVPPGSYLIRSPPNAERWIEQPVTVGSADVADLVVAARAGVSVSGHVDIGKPLTEVIAFQVTLHRESVKIESDVSGSFTIPDVPAGRFSFFATSVTRGWRLVSATLAGREIQGSLLEIGTSPLQGLVLRFTDLPSTLGGTIVDPRASSFKDATVVMFPADASLWPTARADSPLFRSIRTITGQYAIEDIPLGDQIVAALDDAVMEDWPDARLLARLAAIGQRVRVVPGQQLRRDLRLEQIR